VTQFELAKKLGISPRMMAYYEAQTDRPPPHLLEPLSKILGYSIEQLLGVSVVEVETPDVNMRFWRQLRCVEQLSPEDRKAVLRYIQALIAESKLKRDRSHG
jgi:transcriptional regulator with XRE-family HTH domain